MGSLMRSNLLSLSKCKLTFSKISISQDSTSQLQRKTSLLESTSSEIYISDFSLSKCEISKADNPDFALFSFTSSIVDFSGSTFGDVTFTSPVPSMFSFILFSDVEGDSTPIAKHLVKKVVFPDLSQQKDSIAHIILYTNKLTDYSVVDMFPDYSIDTSRIIGHTQANPEIYHSIFCFQNKKTSTSVVSAHGFDDYTWSSPECPVATIGRARSLSNDITFLNDLEITIPSSFTTPASLSGDIASSAHLQLSSTFAFNISSQVNFTTIDFSVHETPQLVCFVVGSAGTMQATNVRWYMSTGVTDPSLSRLVELNTGRLVMKNCTLGQTVAFRNTAFLLVSPQSVEFTMVDVYLDKMESKSCLVVQTSIEQMTNVSLMSCNFTYHKARTQLTPLESLEMLCTWDTATVELYNIARVTLVGNSFRQMDNALLVTNCTVASNDTEIVGGKLHDVYSSIRHPLQCKDSIFRNYFTDDISLNKTLWWVRSDGCTTTGCTSNFFVPTISSVEQDGTNQTGGLYVVKGSNLFPCDIRFVLLKRFGADSNETRLTSVQFIDEQTAHVTVNPTSLAANGEFAIQLCYGLKGQCLSSHTIFVNKKVAFHFYDIFIVLFVILSLVCMVGSLVFTIITFVRHRVPQVPPTQGFLKDALLKDHD
ncbi:hypothetical protein BLNAU_6309 [Blattamonas nauphoetae]|uniref:Transmembrane protein n=1 Tax=Blattamonas nauphoetae TaxID=2049346 RepID=A0ABQ9Y4Z1_9EUKA|nr:hypothetical protein BLNAU_6309 [Blattamonas nauphoetae]